MYISGIGILDRKLWMKNHSEDKNTKDSETDESRITESLTDKQFHVSSIIPDDYYEKLFKIDRKE